MLLGAGAAQAFRSRGGFGDHQAQGVRSVRWGDGTESEAPVAQLFGRQAAGAFPARMISAPSAKALRSVDERC